MPPAVQSMTNRTLSGLFWTALSTGANTGALLLVLIVLARLLTPADFGLAAVAIMVIGFSAIFSEFGIGPAVVQRPDLQAAHLGSGWTLSVALGVLLGAIVWLTAPLVAAFFQLEPLTPMLRVLACIFPVQGLSVVSQSLLQRELRFRTLAVIEIVTSIVGYGIMGVTLALLGFGAWALIGAHLAQASLKTVLSLIARPHRIWPLVDRRACADLLYFGSGFTVGRVSNYAAGQGENVVIGYCLGAVALGIYGRAYQLMAGPAVLFGNVLDRVLFPAMVHVQHDPRRLADAYRRGTALVALVILPVSALVVALAPEVIAILLGSEWDAVVLPLQILSVGMLFRTGCKISDSLVRAIGAVYRRRLAAGGVCRARRGGRVDRPMVGHRGRRAGDSRDPGGQLPAHGAPEPGVDRHVVAHVRAGPSAWIGPGGGCRPAGRSDRDAAPRRRRVGAAGAHRRGRGDRAGALGNTLAAGRLPRRRRPMDGPETPGVPPANHRRRSTGVKPSRRARPSAVAADARPGRRRRALLPVEGTFSMWRAC